MMMLGRIKVRQQIYHWRPNQFQRVLVKNSSISCKYGKNRIYRNVENYGRMVINLINASSAYLNDERI